VEVKVTRTSNARPSPAPAANPHRHSVLVGQPSAKPVRTPVLRPHHEPSHTVTPPGRNWFHAQLTVSSRCTMPCARCEANLCCVSGSSARGKLPPMPARCRSTALAPHSTRRGSSTANGPDYPVISSRAASSPRCARATRLRSSTTASLRWPNARRRALALRAPPPSRPIAAMCSRSRLTVSPPFRPATLASSAVHSCAVPF
jgi:hypothetical protein